MKTYDIIPVPKPRMTRRDKWAKRPCVLRYRAFADEVRANNVQLPIPYKVTFYLPMPKSWPAKKKKAFNGRPHTQKPDKDNLEKALLDAIHKDDSHVWSGWAEKRWGYYGQIKIENAIPAGYAWGYAESELEDLIMPTVNGDNFNFGGKDEYPKS